MYRILVQAAASSSGSKEVNYEQQSGITEITLSLRTFRDI